MQSVLLHYCAKISLLFSFQSIISTQHISNRSGSGKSARLFLSLSTLYFSIIKIVLAPIFTLIKIKRYIKELIYVFFKPFTRFSYFVMYSNLSSLSLSLSRKLREVLWLLIIILIQMSYISESNDSYRYLLQSTRKIDIIVSPLKVDKISFLLQFSVPSPKHFETLIV